MVKVHSKKKPPIKGQYQGRCGQLKGRNKCTEGVRQKGGVVVSHLPPLCVSLSLSFPYTSIVYAVHGPMMIAMVNISMAGLDPTISRPSQRK